MKATEARKINTDQEAVDNTSIVLDRIRHAASRRLWRIEVDVGLMTAATAKRLKELGYSVLWLRKSHPTREHWFGHKSVCVVTW